MKILRYIKKWLIELMDSGFCVSTGVDSHSWESKIEILRNH